MSDKIVKNLNFGKDAKDKVFKGIDKLTKAVSSTLGASGKCVILEDNKGKPIITKDGVTVAESIILLDPVENMGATLLKQAARQTVQDAGDGTTTATLLAHSILEEAQENNGDQVRDIKIGINNGVKKVVKYLEKNSIPVKGDMIDQVATISTNNDEYLGKLIGKAFKAVDETGVVIMEPTDNNETYVDIVDGVQYEKGLLNSHFITNKEKKTAELENPYVLLIESEVTSIRSIQSVLEFVIKNNKPLLIVADMDNPVVSALAMNKIKGNIKVNIINAPTYGVNKKDTLDDLAMLTGATIINEDLGDTLDLIQPDYLGTCIRSVTSDSETIIQVDTPSDEVESIVKELKKQLKKTKSPGDIIRLEKRLARLSAKVAVVKVGASSEVELKEKQDRVEDAICATKAAIKEGIVSGGGIALLNASQQIKPKSTGESILLQAIRKPFDCILQNAGIENDVPIDKEGFGINVVTGDMVNMIESGIIDPLLVTKSALKNAASVATTILSTDCVINNLRLDESCRV